MVLPICIRASAPNPGFPKRASAKETSSSRVQRLTAESSLPRVSRGFYPLAEPSQGML
jgi:hypothetical protein